jgi:hypothetical protein
MKSRLQRYGHIQSCEPGAFSYCRYCGRNLASIRRGDWLDGKLMSDLLSEHVDQQWRLAQDNPSRYYRYTQHRNAFVGLTAIELWASYDSMRQE